MLQKPKHACCDGIELTFGPASQSNTVEWKIPAHAPGFFQKFPRGIGTDFSGVILRTGSSLTPAQQSRFQPGTRVLGMIPVETSVRHGQGSLATHVSVRVENLAAIPASIDTSLSSEEAAGLPLASTTALQLVRKARAGSKVLVLGGSTSVGLILLQMLKVEGAGHIVATASGVKKDTVKTRGADEVIDYREEDVVQTLKRNHSREQFDVILDTVGDFAVFGACAAYLKESGEYANAGASDMKPDGSIWSNLSFLRNLVSLYLPWWLGGVPRKSSWVEFIRGALPEVTDRYLVTKEVTCPIDSRFAFNDAPKAYERLMTGRALGKIIVNIKHPGHPSVSSHP